MARSGGRFKTLPRVGPWPHPLGNHDGERMFRPMEEPRKSTPASPAEPPAASPGPVPPAAPPPREIGGPPGPEPTRHGDWHYKGRCTDF